MSAFPATHPTDETLRSYGLGKLADGSADAVKQHIGVLPRLSAPHRRADVGQPPGSAASDPGPARFCAVPSSRRPTAYPCWMAPRVPLLRLRPAPCPRGLADHPDYEVLRELGRGGMGVVYLAENRLMGRKEVLKVVGSHLISRPGVLDRFLREIRSAARLHHPNIVAAYSAIRLGESLVLAMEYVEGLDLAQDGQGQGAAAGGPCLQLHPPGGAGVAARPRARDGPPRHQAGQPDARPRGEARRSSRCSTSGWPR